MGFWKKRKINVDKLVDYPSNCLMFMSQVKILNLGLCSISSSPRARRQGIENHPKVNTKVNTKLS